YIRLKFSLTTEDVYSTPELQSFSVVFPEEYETEKLIESPVIDVASTVGRAYTGSIDIVKTEPEGTSVEVKLRGSDDGEVWGEWEPVESGVIPYHPFVQYQAKLTGDRTATPELTSVKLDYLTRYEEE